MIKSLGLLLLLFCLGGIGGCGSASGGEEYVVDAGVIADAQTSFVVRGGAYGLRQPIRLRLIHDEGSELLDISRDGLFAFTRAFEIGDSYAVELAEAASCILQGATGTIDGADPDIGVACDAAIGLRDLTLSGPSAPEFASALAADPERVDFVASVSLLQSYVSITARAIYPRSTITVAGQPVGNGIPSAPVPLDLGENTVEIAVSIPGLGERTYRVAIERIIEIAEVAYSKASNIESGDLFGFSTAIDGDILAVSAYREDSAAVGVSGDEGNNSAIDSGAVYIFRRNGSSWVQEAYLKASNTDANDRFGTSLALYGDTLAIGAPGEASASSGVGGNEGNNAAPSSGAVYIFRRNGVLWRQEAYLKASNARTGDNFGASLSLGANTVAVGAHLEDGGGDDSGAVYVFRRSGANWSQEAYLKSSNAGGGDGFGVSVSLAGDTLAIGAHHEDSASTGVDGDQGDNPQATDSGAVYVFRRSGGQWRQEAYVKASNTDTGDNFGVSVALGTDIMAVGADREDSSGVGIDGAQGNSAVSPDSGAAYIFRRNGGSWAQTAYIKASNTDDDDRFGHSLAISGNTLAVGAYSEDSFSTGINGDQGDDIDTQNSGAVYLLRCIEGQWTQEAYLKASNATSRDSFGFQVALSGDSLAVGAYLQDSAPEGSGESVLTASGALYIFE